MMLIVSTVVRWRLWTATTNRPIFNTKIIYEHGESWWKNIDGELLIRPPELSDIITSSHIVSTQENLVKAMMNFALRSIFSYSEVFFIMP
jgi:hypothetical protein